ncbi:hypothetical protein L7F22_049736 [Adiantum nelumboides]|nr:hypothetical protein [Adiantum nelumboides]
MEKLPTMARNRQQEAKDLAVGRRGWRGNASLDVLMVSSNKVPPPTERNKAEKKQLYLGEGKEKVVSVGSQKPHEDIPAQITQGSEKTTETAMSSEVVGSQIIHENSAAEKKQNVVGRGSCAAELPKPNVDGTGNEKAKQQQAKKTKGKGSLVKPTEKVQVPKEVKKPKGKDTSAALNLSKASEQPVKKKLPLQAATLGSPSKRAKVGSSCPPYIKLYIDGKLVQMCRADPACPSQNTKMENLHCVQRRVRVGYVSIKDEDTVEDFSDQLEEYEKRGPAKPTVKVKKEEKESDLVEIYDSSDEEEVHEDQEEAEDEGGEEESGEKEEKSICEEGEEDDDEGGDEEGGDEEGVDDEEEGGEKAKEEGRESDEDNEDGSDGEKTDEGHGSTGDDEDSKDDGKGSGDDGNGWKQ